MSTLTPQTVVLLQQIVAGCRGAAAGFRRAATEQADARLQMLLNNYAQLREQLAGELERCMHHSDGAERAAGPHRAKPARWADGAIDGEPCGLLGCRNHDEQTLRQYQWLLKRDLPAELRQVISRQHAAVQGDLQRLCELTAPVPANEPAGRNAPATGAN